MSRVRRAKCKDGEDCQFCGCCATASGWECGSRRNGIVIWQSDACQANELEAEIQRKEDLLRELVELVEYEPELTAEKWVEKLNQLSKQAKQEIGDE